jgi:hypothetical protein
MGGVWDGFAAWMLSTASTVYQQTWDFWSNVGTAIYDFLIGKSLIEDIPLWLTQAVLDTAIKFFSDLGTSLAAAATAAWNMAGTAISAGIAAAGNLMAAGKDAVVAGATAAFDGVSAAASVVADTATQMGTDFVDSAAAAIGAGQDAITAAAVTAVDALESAGTSAVDWGTNTASGFVDGLTSTLTDGYDAVSGAIGSLTDLIEGYSPPKAGPLQNIDKWGENIGRTYTEGIGKGIADGAKNLTSALPALGNEMSGARVGQAQGNIGSIVSSSMGFAKQGLALAGGGSVPVSGLPSSVSPLPGLSGGNSNLDQIMEKYMLAMVNKIQPMNITVQGNIQSKDDVKSLATQITSEWKQQSRRR